MDYKVGTIYKIVCNIDSSIVYVGSTTKSIKTRMSRHVTQYKLYKRGLYGFYTLYEFFDKYGCDNFTIIKIREYLVCDKYHLLMYEMLWMNKTRLETKILINKYHSFNLTLRSRTLNIINNNGKFYVENQDKLKFTKCEKCGLMFKLGNLHLHQKSIKCKKLMKIKNI
jgi:hypothetical protein